MTVTEKLGGYLMARSSRRSFLARTTMTATALSVAPIDFMLRPGTAYAAICECAPGAECDCSSFCCDGYTQFCCTINNGLNTCPPGTFAGGWWKADGSAYCAGARYYIDCMGECDGCGCGGGSFCPSCDGLTCECALGSCNNRHVGCTEFRYGQCHQEIACSGRIACRVVSCTPPWVLDSTCSTVAQTDESTANHFASCLVAPPPPPPPPPQPSFRRLPGKAVDIGGGADGSVWVVGINPVLGGNGIYRWTGSSWAGFEGGAVRIAVGPDGSPWVANSAKQIFHRSGSAWVRYPGAATDVAVGADGTVWVVGINPVLGGYGLYRLSGSRWIQEPGGAVRIAVGPDGSPWVTNSADQILHLEQSGWVRYPGAGKDVAVGPDGTVWVVGINPVLGGYGVYRWGPTDWAKVGGGAVNITVGSDGLPWVTNSANEIFAG
jgi:Tectonin domain